MAVSVADFVVDGLTADAAWSAPSAISLGGLGGGFELGVELTDFVLILNSHGAVESFRKGSNVTLGGNMTVAIGPLGRNVEADVSLRNAASFYTYSKSRCVLCVCVCVCVRVCVRACVRACVCVSPLFLFLSLSISPSAFFPSRLVSVPSSAPVVCLRASRWRARSSASARVRIESKDKAEIANGTV
jgi:hypothetical protein